MEDLQPFGVSFDDTGRTVRASRGMWIKGLIDPGVLQALLPDELRGNHLMNRDLFDTSFYDMLMVECL